jgi:hypothetical protein
MSAATPSLPVATQIAVPRRVPADIGALARGEARRLLRHPLFLAGIALSLLLLRDKGDGAALDAFVTGFALLPLAAATLVTANLAALRSRRSGTDELFASLPRPRASRVAGQLLALTVTLPISCGLIAIAYVVDSFDEYPHHGLVLATQLAQGPVMVVVFGALGILLARLVPAAVVAALALVGMIALRATLISPESWLSWLLPIAGGASRSADPVPCGPDAPPGCMAFGGNPMVSGWHLSYLVAFALLAGAGALLAERRRLRAATLVAVAVALAVATKLAAG